MIEFPAPQTAAITQPGEHLEPTHAAA